MRPNDLAIEGKVESEYVHARLAKNRDVATRRVLAHELLDASDREVACPCDPRHLVGRGGRRDVRVEPAARRGDQERATTEREGSCPSGEVQGHEQKIDGFDSCEGNHHAAHAVNDEIAPEQGACRRRKIGNFAQRQGLPVRIRDEADCRVAM
ncbi:MAG: hypothetical protein JWP97_5843 [Labilithrix sp.]|nr:hypothetical protein [Labilithrix sp.]